MIDRRSADQRLLVRVGVALGFGFALFRTVIVVSPGVGDFCGYFFVLGQIRRHGSDLTVSLSSAMFRPTGSMSCMSVFSLSDD